MTPAITILLVALRLASADPESGRPRVAEESTVTTYAVPTALLDARDAMDRKMAMAAGRALGLTADQCDAYYLEIVGLPATGPNGEAIDTHGRGMAAARRAGYTGPNHPKGTGR